LTITDDHWLAWSHYREAACQWTAGCRTTRCSWWGRAPRWRPLAADLGVRL